MKPVVVALLHSLRLLQMVANVGEESRASLHVLGHRSNTSLAGLVRTDGRWIAPIDHTERRLMERRLICRVEDVLRPR